MEDTWVDFVGVAWGVEDAAHIQQHNNKCEWLHKEMNKLQEEEKRKWDFLFQQRFLFDFLEREKEKSHPLYLCPPTRSL